MSQVCFYHRFFFPLFEQDDTGATWSSRRAAVCLLNQLAQRPTPQTQPSWRGTGWRSNCARLTFPDRRHSNFGRDCARASPQAIHKGRSISPRASVRL